MRGKTLLSLLQDYRAEIRASTNAAHNASARENQVRILQRVQETLWEEHDWAHLRIRREIPLQAGQRFYDNPEDIPLDRIEKLEVRYGNAWVEMGETIDTAQYNLWDSDLDQRSWPVSRWQVYEDDTIEMWPIPAENADTETREGVVRVTGIRKLAPLVDDSDRTDLDDRLIVLTAAAEELAKSGAQDAPLKMQAAMDRKLKLIGNQSKMKKFSIGGHNPTTGVPRRGPWPVHYRDRETG